MIKADVKNVTEQYHAAMGFIDMARNSKKYKADLRKGFILMAFMHAQSAAVLDEAAGNLGLSYYDFKNHIKAGCEVLIHGGTVAQALAEINKPYSKYEIPVFRRIDAWLERQR